MAPMGSRIVYRVKILFEPIRNLSNALIRRARGCTWFLLPPEYHDLRNPKRTITKTQRLTLPTVTRSEARGDLILDQAGQRRKCCPPLHARY